MSFVNPVEELVNYIISHIHKSLLLNHLDSQQLQTNIAEGAYILQDIQFNSTSINQNLAFSPIHISSAKASRMNIQLPPLLKIFETPAKIRFTDLELNLCSAKSSGCKVLIQKTEPLAESEESQGVNLLTKSIGKLLSSINVEVCLLTINLVHEDHLFQVTIPKFSYAEASGVKKFRIEGMWISVNNGPDNKICEVENVIEGNISVGTKGLEVTSDLGKISMYLDYSQISSLIQIFSNLEVTDLLETSQSDLIETLKAIEKKIEMPQNIKTKNIRIGIEKIDFFVMKIANGFKKNWEYDLEIHEDIQNRHFHIGLSRIGFEFDTKKWVTIGSAFANFYHFAEQNFSTASELFVSANESYFHDFFKLPSTLNATSENYCVKPLIFFEETFGANSFQFASDAKTTEFSMIPLTIHLNYVILTEILSLYSMFPIKNNGESSSFQSTSARIPKIIIEYSIDENEKCWCNREKRLIKLTVENIFLSLEQKLEINADFVNVWLEESTNIEKIAEFTKIIYGNTTRCDSELEPYEQKDYFSYFDNVQGFITLGKSKTSQSSSKLKVIQQSASGKNKLFSQSGAITAISITSLHVFFSLNTCKALLDFKIPEAVPEEEKKISEKGKFIINIQNFISEMDHTNFSINQLTISGSISDFQCEIMYFSLSCEELQSYTTGSECVKISYNSSLLTIFIKDSIINYAQYKVLSLLFDSISSLVPEKNSASNKVFPVKVTFYNVIFLIPTESGFFSCKISDSEFIFCMQNLTSIKVYIGSMQVMASNVPMTNEKLKEWTDFAGFIVFSITCMELRLTYAFGDPSPTCLFGENCVQAYKDFYICQNNMNSYVMAIECIIGSIVIHLCKDTIEVLSESLNWCFEKNLEVPDPMDQSIYYELPSPCYYYKNIVHLHGIQSGNLPNLISSCNSITINMYSGLSFPIPGQSPKSISNILMFKAENFSIAYKINSGQWKLNCELENLELLNYLQNSQIKKIICKDLKNFKNFLVKFEITGKNLIEDPDDLQILIDISPIKINIDQCFLEFIFEWMKENESETPVLLPSSSENKGFFIEFIQISPISLSVDYTSTGDSLASLLKIEDFNLLLPEFKGKKFENLNEALVETWKFWVEHLQHQKYIALIGTLSPIVSITNIGTAVYGLIRKPFGSENSIEGTKQGILSVIKVFSLEGLRVCDTLLGGLGKIIGKVKPWGQRSYKSGLYKNVGQVFKYIQPDKKQLQTEMNKFKRQ